MISNKFKWIIGLVFVFFLIVSTNLIDRDNFRRINDTVKTIYEDRLVAKDIVFEISLLIQNKKLVLVTEDTLFFTSSTTNNTIKIDSYLDQFGQTKLTPKETEVFKTLENLIESMSLIENKMIAINSFKASTNELIELLRTITLIENNLYELSKIQMEEGKRQKSIASHSIGIIEFYTQFEIVALFVLGFIIQILILYKPKGIKKNED
ncbi:MAG: MCP four helix bundle domain-containing protein [Putridiphycobacter sp.]|nr:MCP four helix bundle domain-containing protein [Putridiphycobacter sp.]